jgi:hypothetical protein
MGWFDSWFFLWVGSFALYVGISCHLMRAGRLTYL